MKIEIDSLVFPLSCGGTPIYTPKREGRTSWSLLPNTFSFDINEERAEAWRKRRRYGNGEYFALRYKVPWWKRMKKYFD